MNVFKKFEDNPGLGDEHGNIWRAINHCYTRIAVVDERVRVGLIFGLSVLGFLVAVQLICLGIMVK